MVKNDYRVVDYSMLGKKVPYIVEDSFVSRCLTAQPGARFILVTCMEGAVGGKCPRIKGHIHHQHLPSSAF